MGARCVQARERARTCSATCRRAAALPRAAPARMHAWCMHAACRRGGAAEAHQGDVGRLAQERQRPHEEVRFAHLRAVHTPWSRHYCAAIDMLSPSSESAAACCCSTGSTGIHLTQRSPLPCSPREEHAARLVAVEHGDHLARRDGRAARVHQAQRVVQVARLAVHLVCARARPQAPAGKPGMPRARTSRLPGTDRHACSTCSRACGVSCAASVAGRQTETPSHFALARV
jgi:hypothetical protein